ncbi:hypothetical protein BDV12DRAFT_199954 [Aspergillus spectabilis]
MPAKPRYSPSGLYRHVSPPRTTLERTCSLTQPRFISHPGVSELRGLWKTSKDNEANHRYWQGYLKTRPKYPVSFLDRIYRYHASHARTSLFGTAHDVGAGPGQVSAQLALKFAHVVVSDSSAEHVTLAESYLQRTAISPSKFEFTVSRGEDLGSRYPPGSADLIVCALMFPLMDTVAALKSFRTLLKPGGTLAIWFYGRAHFSEPKYAPTCQALLDAIINHHFAGVIKGGGPESRAECKRVADSIASWLDYIPFSEDEWVAVERHKWNRSWASLGFFGHEAGDFAFEPESNVRDSELVDEREDRNLWRKDWDAAQLKEFVQYIYPFECMDEDPVVPLWNDLVVAMGGLHARRAFSWPVAIVLATRR